MLQHDESLKQKATYCIILFMGNIFRISKPNDTESRRLLRKTGGDED